MFSKRNHLWNNPTVVESTRFLEEWSSVERAHTVAHTISFDSPLPLHCSVPQHSHERSRAVQRAGPSVTLWELACPIASSAHVRGAGGLLSWPAVRHVCFGPSVACARRPVSQLSQRRERDGAGGGGPACASRRVTPLSITGGCVRLKRPRLPSPRRPAGPWLPGPFKRRPTPLVSFFSAKRWKAHRRVKIRRPFLRGGRCR